jgi:hypothetical protein
MNVEIGAEAAQFLFWEYINGIFVAVQEDLERETIYRQETGKRVGGSQIIRQRERLLLCKSFNILWGHVTPPPPHVHVKCMSKLEERDMTGGDRAIPSSWGSCTN